MSEITPKINTPQDQEPEYHRLSMILLKEIVQYEVEK